MNIVDETVQVSYGVCPAARVEPHDRALWDPACSLSDYKSQDEAVLKRIVTDPFYAVRYGHLCLQYDTVINVFVNKDRW